MFARAKLGYCNIKIIAYHIRIVNHRLLEESRFSGKVLLSQHLSPLQETPDRPLRSFLSFIIAISKDRKQSNRVTNREDMDTAFFLIRHFQRIHTQLLQARH